MVKDIESIINPKSIAVVGATNRPGSVGSAIFWNILSAGYQGILYPVQPTAQKAYPRLGDIPDKIDLAVANRYCPDSGDFHHGARGRIKECQGGCTWSGSSRSGKGVLAGETVHTVAATMARPSAKGMDSPLQVIMVFCRSLADASSARIYLIFCPILRRRHIRHYNIGAPHKPQFPAGSGIDGGQGSCSGNIGLRTYNSAQGNHLVGHLFAVGYLFICRDHALPFSGT